MISAWRLPGIPLQRVPSPTVIMLIPKPLFRACFPMMKSLRRLTCASTRRAMNVNTRMIKTFTIKIYNKKVHGR